MNYSHEHLKNNLPAVSKNFFPEQKSRSAKSPHTAIYSSEVVQHQGQTDDNTPDR